MAEGNVAKGAATSGFKGATAGAKIGSIVPGVGTAIGAAVGGGIGAIAGGLKANKSEKEREAGLRLPNEEDPTQTSRLLEIDRMAKNIQSGTDSATQTALNKVGQTTAGTQARLSRVTGGNTGGTVDALLKAQRAGGDASNQAVAQGQARLPFFMNLGQQLANRQEQRALELNLLGRAQTSAETAEEQKERNVNSNSLLVSGLAGSNLSKPEGRISSLINQGMGKLQGDVEKMDPTAMTGINNAPPQAPSISSLMGGGAGDAINLGGLPAAGLIGG